MNDEIPITNAMREIARRDRLNLNVAEERRKAHQLALHEAHPPDPDAQFAERTPEEHDPVRFSEACEAVGKRLHLDLSSREGRLAAATVVARESPDLIPLYGYDSVRAEALGVKVFRELQKKAGAAGFNFREDFPAATRALLGSTEGSTVNLAEASHAQIDELVTKVATELGLDVRDHAQRRTALWEVGRRYGWSR